MLHLGFTGTQAGLTTQQRVGLDKLIAALWMHDPGIVAHHGDCVGADAAFHTICETHQIKLIGHIPDIDARRAFLNFDEACKPLPYLVRNRAIVEVSHLMIACPKEDRMQARSGTWATARYATQVGKPIAFVFPLGQIVLPNDWPTEAASSPER